MGNDFLLHRGIDNYPLQVFGFDGLNRDCGVDGGLEQQLQAVFVQGSAKAANLCGIAWQSVFKVLHATEELPQDVLAPAHNEFFVAEVETVLEVEQAGHQANGQFGPTGVTATCAHQDLGGAKHVLVFEDLADAIPMFELCRYRCFDLVPWQPSRQHRQGVVQIDHGVNGGCGESRSVAYSNPSESISTINVF